MPMYLLRLSEPNAYDTHERGTIIVVKGKGQVWRQESYDSYKPQWVLIEENITVVSKLPAQIF